VSYDPEELRRVAGAPPHDGDCWDNEWVIAQLRAHADLMERYAKLKEHAEAMANSHDKGGNYVSLATALAAYRRDFPKDEK